KPTVDRCAAVLVMLPLLASRGCRVRNSENRDRVDRRAGTPRHPQRRDHAEELPSALLDACARNVFELQVVQEMDPHSVQRQRMDRRQHVVDGAGPGIAVAVGPKHAYLALPQQTHRGDMESSAQIEGSPRSKRLTPLVVTAPDQDDVAFAETDALSLFGGHNLVWQDRGAGFQPVDAPQVGDIEQDATPNDAVFYGHHRSEGRTGRADAALGYSVVQLTAKVGVTEGIQVRCRLAVEVAAEEVGIRLWLSRVSVAQLRHVVQRRPGIVRAGFGVPGQ